MAEKFKINVAIGGRTYPLSINNPEEEEGMRRAAEKINSLIVKFEQNYAVNDKQDVLAMCALQFASKLEISSVIENKDIVKVSEKLNTINDLLDRYLE